MGQDSSIEWTHHTFNSWWGCTKVSPGCANCYAARHSARFGKQLFWGANASRRFFAEQHWNEPRKWNREATKRGQRMRVFCGSMCDVFEDRLDLVPHRVQLWDLITQTPQLDWLLLTKRPENILRLAPGAFPDNVWVGTSAENQAYWDTRVPLLLEVPVAIRFISAEPMVGPITLNGLRPEWVISGGESGPRSRPMDEQWVHDLRNECVAAHIPFFFKQWGGRNKKLTGRHVDGRTWDQLPMEGTTQPR